MDPSARPAGEQIVAREVVEIGPSGLVADAVAAGMTVVCIDLLGVPDRVGQERDLAPFRPSKPLSRALSASFSLTG